MKTRMAFVGGGNMAEALLKGLISTGKVEASQVIVSDISSDRLAQLSSTYGVHTVSNNAEAVQDATAVWLCVKPQQMEQVLSEVTGAVPGALFVSIAAGVPLAALERGLGSGSRVVRVMPNTPALVGQGAAGLAGGNQATETDVKQVLDWMSCVGRAVVVDEEDLHAVTALSGSGPAYVFHLVESMLGAAENLGLNPEIAHKLVVQTVIGAGRLLEASDCTAGELRERVTSKGGTTAAALEAFRSAGVEDGIRNGVLAAARRSRELAEGA